MSHPVIVGYLPLSDALPLLAARELGLYAREGLSVELRPLRSWAQIRDALLLGEVQAAHCLAGIPLAAQAGLFGRPAPLATALTLNHFGNAISLATDLMAEIENGAASFATGLRQAALVRRDSSRPLTLASVFPVSKHEFELRHWLRGFELDPDYDVNLVVVPPPLVDEALRAGRIHGYCVGEPWNSLSQEAGSGQVVATSQSLGLPGTEKVLAVHEGWLDDPAHHALVRALDTACNWLAASENRRRAAVWLGSTLDLSEAVVRPGLLATGSAQPHIQFAGVQYPDLQQARWLLEQMQACGAGLDAGKLTRISERAFRPAHYRQIMGMPIRRQPRNGATQHNAGADNG